MSSGILGQGALGEFTLGEVALPVAAGTVYSRTLSDSASVEDSPSRTARSFRAIADPSEIAELIARSQLHGRRALDDLPVTDALDRIVERRRILLDSADPIYDLVSKSSSFGRITFDSFDTRDVIVRQLIAARILSEDLSIHDSVLRTVLAFRALLEPLGIEDSISVSIVFGGGALLSRVITDSLSLSDLAGRSTQAQRVVSDFLQPAENIARALLRNRVTSDPVEAVDSALRYMIFGKILADSFEARDDLISQIGYLELFIGIVLAELERSSSVMSMSRIEPIEFGTAESLPVVLSTQGEGRAEIGTEPAANVKLEVTNQ